MRCHSVQPRSFSGWKKCSQTVANRSTYRYRQLPPSVLRWQRITTLSSAFLLFMFSLLNTFCSKRSSRSASRDKFSMNCCDVITPGCNFAGNERQFRQLGFNRFLITKMWNQTTVRAGPFLLGVSMPSNFRMESFSPSNLSNYPLHKAYNSCGKNITKRECVNWMIHSETKLQGYRDSSD